MKAPPDLTELASRYWESAALNAAVALGVFPILAEAPAAAEALSNRLNTAPQHNEALLDGLCGLGVLIKTDGQYAIPDALKPLLDPASPDCLLGALAFNADLFQLWAKLPECIQSGRPVLPANPHLGGDPARTRRFVEGMHSRAGIMARGLLPALIPAPRSRILDVGGGPGTFSVKLLERDPTLTATVLDLPPVVQAAADIHAGNPVLERLTFLGGDYHTADLPADQDLVLYCGALHQEPDDALPALFQRMKAALKPSGTLCVVDLMVTNDRTQPVYSALFQLNMMLMRPASRVHSTGDLDAVLRAAGFTSAPPEAVSGTPYTLVRATQ
ncbi:MAG: acetylserotonin O-methyltransferase [Kiritimatiellae bacterium]|nr:acetylserotonin O-methyltransferase [Kiritimatiellia bacterium]